MKVQRIIILMGWLGYFLVAFSLPGAHASLVMGDFNNDTVVNSLDITGFKLALDDKTAWEGTSGLDADVIGDFNFDGTFNILDIEGFKHLLRTGIPPRSSHLPGSCECLSPGRGRFGCRNLEHQCQRERYGELAV